LWSFFRREQGRIEPCLEKWTEGLGLATFSWNLKGWFAKKRKGSRLVVFLLGGTPEERGVISHGATEGGYPSGKELARGKKKGKAIVRVSHSQGERKTPC